MIDMQQLRRFAQEKKSFMGISQGSDEALIAAIRATPKALVFLSVPWSCPERIARQHFVDATFRLPELSMGMECFLIDEEAEACRQWLSTLNLQQIGRYPLGAGSLLWLEYGRIITFEVSGQIPAEEIIGRCQRIWARSS